ncbi:hypothetical protein GGR50DRAFT_690613 [Xylaria sp. CBS 124048]|nr:hypothetical protein GGR50DRAFT_690613 [Xylaria sp. CBS 124048]
MTWPGAPGIQQLPYELVTCVVQYLDIEDVFHWSLCSRHFQFIVREDRFCKPVVMTKAANTLEARDALETGAFSRALRRLAKRRSALSRASPFVAGVVAHADSYGFFNGKLCYVTGRCPPRQLRILDVHKSTAWELVVDIPRLIQAAFPEVAPCRRYMFRVLYEAAGIVSCLFTSARDQTESWLLVIKPREQRILETFRLASTTKIFVRNNENFLYFGTLSAEGDDGFPKWVLKGFDLRNLSWLPRTMYLANVVGSDIGSTVCFEIFGDYFYGLSNRTMFEADDPHWTSYYYCFRFPLNQPSVDKMEFMNNEDSWRRNHAEGPIDERWGFLSLETDEANGGIVILECRKEWLGGQSGSRRTYYTTEVIFRRSTAGLANQRRARSNTTRRMGDHPSCDVPPPRRQPSHAHAGDDSTVAMLLVRSRTHFSAYIRCCHTFIDLIDDLGEEDTSSLRRLRLRTGHRKLEPSTSTELELVSEESPWHTPWSLDEASNAEPPVVPPAEANAIFTWPPEHPPSEPNPSLAKVWELFHVESCQSRITAAGDERSVIYATSHSKMGPKSLVFLSFDPAARFEGMERGGNIIGQQTSHNDPRKGTKLASTGLTGSPVWGAGKKICSSSGKGKSMPSSDLGLASSAGLGLLPTVEGPGCWVSYEAAQHLTIQQTQFFGR